MTCPWCLAQGNNEKGEHDFKLGEALAYLANMRTFWMITVGLGERMLLPAVYRWHCNPLHFYYSR